MLESMTGFGRAEHSGRGIRASAEIRSVNNRYTETSFRLPPQLSDYEPRLKQTVLKHIERGKLNITINLEVEDENLVDVQLNKASARAYRKLLEELRQEAGIEEPIRIEHLLGFKDIVTSREVTEDELNRMAEAAAQALEEACTNLSDMRISEGERLKTDLQKRVDQLTEYTSQISELAKKRVPEAKEKLKERIHQLHDDPDKLEQDRLEQEVVMMADRLDISEELVRLESHLHFFRESMDTEKSSGRKLNFLIQEIHREINTIGSKAGNAEISHHVVNMKEIVENIREQVQNIA